MTLRHRKLWLAIGWAMVALVLWLSLKSPSDGPALFNDKLAHFIAYLGMTLWFGQIYRRLGLLAAAMLALGALIEVLQGMTGYRDMSLADLLTYLVAHRDRGDLLKPGTWDVLHTPPFGGDYAMGWVVRPDGARWHNGSNTLWYAEASFDAKTGVASAAAANDASPPTPPVVGQIRAEAAAAV